MLELVQNPADMHLLHDSPDRDSLFNVNTVTAVGRRTSKADIVQQATMCYRTQAGFLSLSV